LRQAHAAGNSAKAIHHKQILPIQYSISSIQKKLCRLGLARNLPKYKKFNSVTKDIFVKFITDNWVGRLPDELAQMWNRCNASYPVTARRVIMYLTKLGVKVACYEMGRIRKLRQYENQIRTSGEYNPTDVNDKIRWNRAELMACRLANNQDIWSGLQMASSINIEED